MLQLTCEQCGREFEATRRTRKFCSPTCRSRHRRRPAEGTPVPGMVDQVTRDLERINQLDTAIGQQCLLVARRLESPVETGAAISSLSKELSRLMAVANGSGANLDPLDEVARKRDEKTARARQASR